uniref:Peptidase S1 domain-containing protein n=1 Tax=Stegastes partitus TaxID=144197 RepID=A0A3B4ZKM8_9TELE
MIKDVVVVIYRLSMSPTECGQRPAVGVHPHRKKRILGGRVSRRGAWPWQCSLQSGQSGHVCGCVLIGRRWALTVAHCFEGSVAHNRDDDGVPPHEVDYGFCEPSFSVSSVCSGRQRRPAGLRGRWRPLDAVRPDVVGQRLLQQSARTRSLQQRDAFHAVDPPADLHPDVPERLN